MAIIVDIEENGQPLSLRLDLLQLETYTDATTEGWIKYDLNLFCGSETITKVSGTIHDNDLRFIEKAFTHVKKCHIEPLEPDFQIAIESTKYDEITITCMIKYSFSSTDKTYGDSAIGLRLVTTKKAARDFADQLKAERVHLTDDAAFTEYESKQL